MALTLTLQVTYDPVARGSPAGLFNTTDFGNWLVSQAPFSRFALLCAAGCALTLNAQYSGLSSSYVVVKAGTYTCAPQPPAAGRAARLTDTALLRSVSTPNDGLGHWNLHK